MQTVKVYLRRVRLNSGGYDDDGRYWGVGAPLYQADLDFYHEEHGNICHTEHLRASSRDAAKVRLKSMVSSSWEFAYGIKVDFFR